jgi:hypothetical protein
MNVPVVPLSAFSNLAGSALAEDLRRLLANPDYAWLVLFSDTLGEQLALLPVGPGQAYGRLDEVDGAEIEGLRPLCALRMRGAGPSSESKDTEREQEMTKREEALKKRERELEEREQSLAEREQMLVDKEREFFRQGGAAARQVVNG